MHMIGTAGLSIPRQHAASFPSEGSHLQRYGQVFCAVEINSSFYKPHKPETYARWAASVPPSFRFAVKMPKEITHNRKLIDTSEPLEPFLEQIRSLGEKLGPLLVQLPPSLGYDAAIAVGFFEDLRKRFAGNVVCEPRHPSWFTAEADAALVQFSIARVAADPAVVPLAALPGGWPGLIYRRLHGSPKLYYSVYSADYLDSLTSTLGETENAVQEDWCIFDNTALGEATGNALNLLKRMRVAS